MYHTCCNLTPIPEIHIWYVILYITCIQLHCLPFSTLPSTPYIPAPVDHSAISTLYSIFSYCYTCDMKTLYLICSPHFPSCPGNWYHSSRLGSNITSSVKYSMTHHTVNHPLPCNLIALYNHCRLCHVIPQLLISTLFTSHDVRFTRGLNESLE